MHSGPHYRVKCSVDLSVILNDLSQEFLAFTTPKSETHIYLLHIHFP